MKLYKSSVCCILFIFGTVLLTQGAASSSYSTSSNNGYSGGDSQSSPPSYRFQYGVYDSKYGNDFGHEEERNGQETKGRYKVQLPDGRVQVVTYTADQNGYRATVTYESGSSGGLSSGNSQSSGGYQQASPSNQVSSTYGSSDQRTFSTLKTKINGKFYGY
ncbi:unnamed protein product [Allacma fusca]|uniref:Pro-resilin n=1 Tax=Allacma fusca TaxID=39272 RepID=A0A8J2PJJ3_9HEXA|nr:unnamed protein product [Allacma fusca]